MIACNFNKPKTLDKVAAGMHTIVISEMDQRVRTIRYHVFRDESRRICRLQSFTPCRLNDGSGLRNRDRTTFIIQKVKQ